MATATLHVQLIDALRGTDRAAGHRSLLRLLALSAAGVATYGAVMGSFGVFYGGSAWQVIYAAVKSPVLLLVTFALTMPSFTVLHLLLGLREDLGEVLHALLSAQVAVAIGLLSLSPLTLLFYVSQSDYETAVLFNGAMFALASFGGQRPLRRRYEPLVRRNRVHARLLRVWIGVYAFVGVQMGWVLRPFIGKPHAPAQFLRPEKWDNAYVIVARMAWHAVTGHSP